MHPAAESSAYSFELSVVALKNQPESQFLRNRMYEELKAKCYRNLSATHLFCGNPGFIVEILDMLANEAAIPTSANYAAVEILRAGDETMDSCLTCIDTFHKGLTMFKRIAQSWLDINEIEIKRCFLVHHMVQRVVKNMEKLHNEASKQMEAASNTLDSISVTTQEAFLVAGYEILRHPFILLNFEEVNVTYMNILRTPLAEILWKSEHVLPVRPFSSQIISKLDYNNM